MFIVNQRQSDHQWSSMIINDDHQWSSSSSSSSLSKNQWWFSPYFLHVLVFGCFQWGALCPGMRTWRILQLLPCGTSQEAHQFGQSPKERSWRWLDDDWMMIFVGIPHQKICQTDGMGLMELIGLMGLMGNWMPWGSQPKQSHEFWVFWKDLEDLDWMIWIGWFFLTGWFWMRICMMMLLANLYSNVGRIRCPNVKHCQTNNVPKRSSKWEDSLQEATGKSWRAALARNCFLVCFGTPWVTRDGSLCC